MALEGQDEEEALGSTGKEGRRNHVLESEKGAQGIRLEMLLENWAGHLGGMFSSESQVLSQSLESGAIWKVQMRKQASSI